MTLKRKANRKRAESKAVQPKGSWRELHGMLKGKGNGVRLSIEEINRATAEAGAAADARYKAERNG